MLNANAPAFVPFSLAGTFIYDCNNSYNVQDFSDSSPSNFMTPFLNYDCNNNYNVQDNFVSSPSNFMTPFQPVGASTFNYDCNSSYNVNVQQNFVSSPSNFMKPFQTVGSSPFSKVLPMAIATYVFS